MPLSPEAVELMKEAVKQAESEGYHTWGFHVSQDEVPDFLTFSGGEMSRSLIIRNTEVALEIMQNNDIRSKAVGEDSQVRLYDA